MTMYLGLDPGHSTGACWVSYRDKQLILHDFTTVKWPAFLDWVLHEWEPKMAQYREPEENVIVVAEDYIHRKAGPFTPSPVPKMIGFAYCKALELKWHFALSQPYNKTAGYKMGKIPTTGNKAQSHWRDSYAHVVFAIHQGLDPEQKIIW